MCGVYDHQLDEIVPGDYAYQLFASYHWDSTDALLKHQVCHLSNRCVFLDRNYGVTHDLLYLFAAHRLGDLNQGLWPDPGAHQGVQVVGHGQELAMKAKVRVGQDTHQVVLLIIQDWEAASGSFQHQLSRLLNR